MAIRKLKLIWQQVHDSTSHLYQPWSFLNIDKPRKIPLNNINSSITTNELRNVFAPSSMPTISNIQSSSISMINTEQSSLINSPTLSKPSVYQTPMETSTNVYLQAPPQPIFSSLDLLPKTQKSNVDTIIQPVIEENKEEYDQVSVHQRKRAKIVDTRPVEIDDDDEDEDGAERKIIFYLIFLNLFIYNFRNFC
jgi:hypothetical protein